ncbi:MAG TPA: FtsX-like permease family protein [Bacteroidota bacterium]|nr:FtsX-like permease family protein [Bacteroidota bacterium]
MIVRMSWKNVWRSKRRSAIVVAAIALGLWGGIFSAGIMEGMAEQMVNSAIERELTHVQIHREGFRDERSELMTIDDAPEVADYARRLPGVSAVTSRSIVDGLVSSPTTSQGARIEGIVPVDEQAATALKKEVVQGAYLDTAQVNGIIIGRKLAEKLAVKVRSKIVLTFQGPDGTLIYGAFRIAGLFETPSSMYDESTVYVNQRDLFGLLGRPMIHEIGIRLSSETLVSSTQGKIHARFPALEVMNWQELAPELKVTAESTAIFMNIFLGIILVALLFGITNTMLMSVLDRVREFGMLMAVGMKRRQVFVMVMVETIFLSLTGGVAGMLLGGGTIALLQKTGIDLSMFSAGLAYYGMSSYLVPTIPASTYPLLALMIVATAVLAAIYPAIKVIQLHPATAIRTYL